MTHKNRTGRFILLFLLLLTTGCSLSPGGEEIIGTETESTKTEEIILENNTSDDRKEIWVHLCGQVNQPGVYSFLEGSRVFDAIEKAGGFTETADREAVNLAMTLTDEGKIYIPAIGEMEQEGSSSGKDSDGKVNLNQASLEELMSLPGIGEKRAEAILKLREERGSFKKVEELLDVEGIKEGIFEQIKDFVKV